jgi:hypothetical protein
VTFSKQNIGYFIFLGMYIDVQTTYNQASNLTYAHLLSVPLTTLRLFFAVQIICFNFSFNLATRHSHWKCTFYYYFADLSQTCMQINKKWVETEICGKRSWWNLSAQTNGKRSWWINFVAALPLLTLSKMKLEPWLYSQRNPGLKCIFSVVFMCSPKRACLLTDSGIFLHCIYFSCNLCFSFHRAFMVAHAIGDIITGDTVEPKVIVTAAPSVWHSRGLCWMENCHRDLISQGRYIAVWHIWYNILKYFLM